ncbi:MAG TPA: RDD family protein [Verrucomicrobiae bacterium]|nr:RDD family protein [Verrucomicrobiae bacterium]
MKSPNYLTKHVIWAGLVLAGGLYFQVGLQAQLSTSSEPGQPAVSVATNTEPAAMQAEAPDTNSVAAADSEPSRPWMHRRPGPLVSVGHDVELKAGDTAEAVVVIGGHATVKGKTRAAVAVFGDLDVEGDVAENAVAVMGNVHIGPGASVGGQAVAVGGKVEYAPSAKLGGEPVTVDFPNWVKQWFLQCFLKLRPLAPQVGWVWAIAGVVFLIYLLIAALFPQPVAACVGELTRRPASTFLLGLLSKLLVPLVVVILAATGIGVVVVPFVLAAVFLGAIIGKVALLEWFGLRLGSHFGSNGLQNRLLAFLLGTIIITLLYMIPVAGLLTFSITAVWGLGAAVTAGFGGLKKELPQKAPAPAPPIPRPMAVSAAGQGMTPGPEPESTQSGFGFGGGGVATTALPATPPVMPEVLAHPKAGFWERMGAGFLDLVLVSILGALVGGPPLGFLVALAYFAGMWAWKATTIGGIVLGLKVVRTDGQPVTFLTALVRALAGAFSIMILFLGILWITWDPEKQGWHDKIAGTLVLRLPKAAPLV